MHTAVFGNCNKCAMSTYDGAKSSGLVHFRN